MLSEKVVTMMSWDQIKKNYFKKHIGINADTDHVRIRAWNKLERFLYDYFPEIISEPEILLSMDRKGYKIKVASLKRNKKLNGGEIAIINFLFNVLLGLEQTPLTYEKKCVI